MGKKKAEEVNTGANGSYIPALDAANAKYDINTTAESVHRRDLLIRIVAIVLAVLLLLMGMGYACTTVINNAGRFTVSMVPNLYGVQLSDTEEFLEPTLTLYATPLEGMDNITKEWILNRDGRVDEDPVYESFDELASYYGSHNGKNYLAYTFGVRNPVIEESDEPVIIDYCATVQIVTSYLDADEAVRVMVIKNGEETVYAKAKKGTENTKEAFACDKVFESDTIVMQEEFKGMKPGQIDQYTVVVWLEGEDPECVNDIMGGELKLKMDFEVIGSTADSEQS